MEAEFVNITLTSNLYPAPICTIKRGEGMLPVYYSDLPFPIMEGDILYSTVCDSMCTVDIGTRDSATAQNNAS